MAIDSQMGSWKMRASHVNLLSLLHSFGFFFLFRCLICQLLLSLFFSFLLHLGFSLYSVASGLPVRVNQHRAELCLMVNVISSCDSTLSLLHTLNIYPCTLALRVATSPTRPHTCLLALAVCHFTYTPEIPTICPNQRAPLPQFLSLQEARYRASGSSGGRKGTGEKLWGDKTRSI